MRRVLNDVHISCFPTYRALQDAKDKYIPKNISITETSAIVPLQTILDATIQRYLDPYEFNGSSGHSTYKQKLSELISSDEFMFVASFVPLRF